MVPATMTIDAIFSQATATVTEFSALILLVAALGLGIWGVKFVVGLVRKARR